MTGGTPVLLGGMLALREGIFALLERMLVLHLMMTDETSVLHLLTGGTPVLLGRMLALREGIVAVLKEE